MNDLIITYNAGSLDCNFDEIDAAIDSTLAEYANSVFTESTKKDAKKTVADLRKEQKALSDKVKAAKNEYMAPWKAFEERAMLTIGKYDKPITFINDQVAAFEEKRKAEKRDQIKDIYIDLVPEEDLQSYIPLNAIYNNKWENATVTEKAIREEIMTLKIKVKNDISVITAMESDDTTGALDLYKRCLNVTDAVQYITQREQQKKEILAREQERLQRENEERIRAEERARIEAEQRAEMEKQAAVEAAKAATIDQFIPEAVADDVPRETITYMIKLNAAEREALEMYMDSVGIEYDELPL